MRRREIDADYAAAAPALKEAWAALDLPTWLSPVSGHLNAAPRGRALDIGAGTGHLARHLSDRGYRVTAVEPVEELWSQIGLTPIQDHLPRLGRVRGTFHLITCIGVIHHLPPAAQQRALLRMASLARPGARIIIGARHGPGPRALWPIRASRLRHPTLRRVSAIRKMSLQPANRATNVRWTWLVFQKRELRSLQRRVTRRS